MASDIPCLRVSREDRVSLEGGVLVLGAIASGKTSATAAMILRRLLADPRIGMLLLTAHPEEVARILGYIRDAGREHDLLRFSRHRFNALEWGRRMGYSVEDLTALVMQSMEVSGRMERSAPHAQDNWLTSMQSLVRAAIQLITLGQDFLSLYDIHRVLISAPADARDPHRPSWQRDSLCYRLIVQARQGVARSGQPLAQHDLRMTEDYFLRFWATLNPRTKTTVVSVFQAFASPFLYGELYQRCCTGLSLDPRATYGGKIILMDTPAESSEAHLILQTQMKACWQLGTRRRRLTPQSGLAVCYADEAALYATSGDGPFLAIARNRKATMVYIGHAIPEFVEKIGRNAAINLFSHFRTKIFHTTNDPETAQYAVSLIGETWQPQRTKTRTESHTASGTMDWLWNAALHLLAMYYGYSWGTSESVTDRLAPQILPHELATLRTGGKANRYLVDVIIVQSGTTWHNQNYLRATLRQDFSQPRRSFLSLLGSWKPFTRHSLHSPESYGATKGQRQGLTKAAREHCTRQK
jgi:hypothetical protein